MLTGAVKSLEARKQVRLDDVRDLDPISRLVAAPEHRRARARDRMPAEDRDDASLALGILAGAVDVAVPERDGGEATEACVQPAVALGCALTLAVGRERPHRMVLGRGKDGRIAVQAPAGRGIDEPTHAVRASRLSTVIVPSTFEVASDTG
jgi:hypothetical protein